MDVTFQPCLGHSTIMELAISIVKSKSIKKLVGEFKTFDRNNFGWTDVIDQDQWNFMTGCANIVFSKIVHPKYDNLIDRVVFVIRPICIEIQKWTDDHRYINITDIDVEDSLYWSYEGLIDREKTAKELVGNENLSIQNRFELACNYCFMSYVESLWNLMSESEKRRYSRNHIPNNRIIDFWIKWLSSGARNDLLLSPDRDFDQLCFYAYYTNTVALRYFLHLLTTEDKEEYLTKIAKEKCLIPRVMRFCLLEMDSHQKADMFTKTPFKTLKCFLDFPWQNSFLIVVIDMWSHLRETDFLHLIYFIIYEKIIPGWQDYNYMELLTDLWRLTPYPFRMYVSNQDIFPLLNFIVGRMMTVHFVSTQDLKNFLEVFILDEEIEERYQKACRSC